MRILPSFIIDEYKKNRGGKWSRWLRITCLTCTKKIFFYQKDGPGPLKRSYLDRIYQFRPQFDDNSFFHCPHCQTVLGFYEPYKKENNRPALRWAKIAIDYTIVSKKAVATATKE